MSKGYDGKEFDEGTYRDMAARGFWRGADFLLVVWQACLQTLALGAAALLSAGVVVSLLAFFGYGPAAFCVGILVIAVFLPACFFRAVDLSNPYRSDRPDSPAYTAWCAWQDRRQHDGGSSEYGDVVCRLLAVKQEVARLTEALRVERKARVEAAENMVEAQKEGKGYQGAFRAEREALRIARSKVDAQAKELRKLRRAYNKLAKSSAK